MVERIRLVVMIMTALAAAGLAVDARAQDYHDENPIPATVQQDLTPIEGLFRPPPPPALTLFPQMREQMQAQRAEIQNKIATTRRFAFEEQDAPVIEAQQELIEAASTPVDPVILAIDVGPVRYKQILRKLIDAVAEATVAG